MIIILFIIEILMMIIIIIILCAWVKDGGLNFKIPLRARKPILSNPNQP